VNGAPGEADQRDLEVGAQQPDRLEELGDVGGRLQRAEPLDVGAGAERLVDERTAPRLDPHGHADGGQRHHDVAEHDGGVDRHPAQRLQGDLDDLLGVLAGLEDVAVAPELPVLGQVAARLPHETTPACGRPAGAGRRGGSGRWARGGAGSVRWLTASSLRKRRPSPRACRPG
jgi:hypothetical protein